jgi:hypothetical protein
MDGLSIQAAPYGAASPATRPRLPEEEARGKMDAKTEGAQAIAENKAYPVSGL